eukprot:m.321530 g.321530  ORF g.321530 m.321530 type:complete len:1706 (+) comp15999_c0_seq2:1359-6476(+)
MFHTFMHTGYGQDAPPEWLRAFGTVLHTTQAMVEQHLPSGKMTYRLVMAPIYKDGQDPFDFPLFLVPYIITGSDIAIMFLTQKHILNTRKLVRENKEYAAGMELIRAGYPGLAQHTDCGIEELMVWRCLDIGLPLLCLFMDSFSEGTCAQELLPFFNALQQASQQPLESVSERQRLLRAATVVDNCASLETEQLISHLAAFLRPLQEGIARLHWHVEPNVSPRYEGHLEDLALSASQMVSIPPDMPELKQAFFGNCILNLHGQAFSGKSLRASTLVICAKAGGEADKTVAYNCKAAEETSSPHDVLKSLCIQLDAQSLTEPVMELMGSYTHEAKTILHATWFNKGERLEVCTRFEAVYGEIAPNDETPHPILVPMSILKHVEGNVYAATADYNCQTQEPLFAATVAIDTQIAIRATRSVPIYIVRSLDTGKLGQLPGFHTVQILSKAQSKEVRQEQQLVASRRSSRILAIDGSSSDTDTDTDTDGDGQPSPHRVEALVDLPQRASKRRLSSHHPVVDAMHQAHLSVSSRRPSGALATSFVALKPSRASSAVNAASADTSDPAALALAALADGGGHGTAATTMAGVDTTDESGSDSSVQHAQGAASPSLGSSSPSRRRGRMRSKTYSGNPTIHLPTICDDGQACRSSRAYAVPSPPTPRTTRAKNDTDLGLDSDPKPSRGKRRHSGRKQNRVRAISDCRRPPSPTMLGLGAPASATVRYLNIPHAHSGDGSPASRRRRSSSVSGFWRLGTIIAIQCEFKSEVSTPLQPRCHFNKGDQVRVLETIEQVILGKLAPVSTQRAFKGNQSTRLKVVDCRSFGGGQYSDRVWRRTKCVQMPADFLDRADASSLAFLHVSGQVRAHPPSPSPSPSPSPQSISTLLSTSSSAFSSMSSSSVTAAVAGVDETVQPFTSGSTKSDSSTTASTSAALATPPCDTTTVSATPSPKAASIRDAAAAAIEGEAEADFPADLPANFGSRRQSKELLQIQQHVFASHIYLQTKASTDSGSSELQLRAGDLFEHIGKASDNMVRVQCVATGNIGIVPEYLLKAPTKRNVPNTLQGAIDLFQEALLRWCQSNPNKRLVLFLDNTDDCLSLFEMKLFPEPFPANARILVTSRTRIDALPAGAVYFEPCVLSEEFCDKFFNQMKNGTPFALEAYRKQRRCLLSTIGMAHIAYQNHVACPFPISQQLQSKLKQLASRGNFLPLTLILAELGKAPNNKGLVSFIESLDGAMDEEQAVEAIRLVLHRLEFGEDESDDEDESGAAGEEEEEEEDSTAEETGSDDDDDEDDGEVDLDLMPGFSEQCIQAAIEVQQNGSPITTLLQFMAVCSSHLHIDDLKALLLDPINFAIAMHSIQHLTRTNGRSIGIRHPSIAQAVRESYLNDRNARKIVHNAVLLYVTEQLQKTGELRYAITAAQQVLALERRDIPIDSTAQEGLLCLVMSPESSAELREELEQTELFPRLLDRLAKFKELQASKCNGASRANRRGARRGARQATKKRHLNFGETVSVRVFNPAVPMLSHAQRSDFAMSVCEDTAVSSTPSSDEAQEAPATSKATTTLHDAVCDLPFQQHDLTVPMAENGKYAFSQDMIVCVRSTTSPDGTASECAAISSAASVTGSVHNLGAHPVHKGPTGDDASPPPTIAPTTTSAAATATGPPPVDTQTLAAMTFPATRRALGRGRRATSAAPPVAIDDDVSVDADVDTDFGED